MTKIACVVFDLGGVLIELDGPPLAPTQPHLNDQDVWQYWLHSETVRQYESGLISTEVFAKQLIEEMALTLTPEEVIHEFTHWPKGWFPESLPLLNELKQRVRLACLSNTNHLHWERFGSEDNLPSYFDDVFASFQLGMMKPDRAIFDHTIAELDLAPNQLLFFDDNVTNVEAARKTGIQAELTRGPAEALTHLKTYGLL